MLERSSAFKRVAFLKPETPQAEVEEQFAELLYRWTTLKKPRQGGAGAGARLADVSEAEYEQFVLLQQQVANAGLRHASDDAGERDSASGSKRPSPGLKARISAPSGAGVRPPPEQR